MLLLALLIAQTFFNITEKVHKWWWKELISVGKSWFLNPKY